MNISLDFKRNLYSSIPIKTQLLIAICCILLLLDPHPVWGTIILIITSIILSKNPVYLIPLIFVTSVSTSIVVIPKLAGIFYYLYLFLFICLLKYGINTSKKNNTVLLIVIYALWLLFSAYNSITGETAIVYRILVAVIPIAICSRYPLDQSKLGYSMLVMAIASSVFVIIKLLYNPILFLPGEGALDTYSTNSAIQLTIAREINPNTLAQFLLIAYLIIYTYALEMKVKKIYLLCILPIIPIVIIGSRTIFLSLIIISAILFMLSSSISTRKKIFISVISFVLGGTLMEYVVSTNNRLGFNTIIENKGSGRFTTWESLFNNVIPEHFIAGIGYGRSNFTALGYSVDADNLYVDILTQLGIVGFCLFFFIFICQFKSLRKIKSINSKLAQSFILFVLFAGLGESIFDTFICWIILFFILLVQTSHQSSKCISYKK